MGGVKIRRGLFLHNLIDEGEMVVIFTYFDDQMKKKRHFQFSSLSDIALSYSEG